MTDELLADAYARCREINREHGTSYYWSTRLLPRAKQPHVFAIYAFCRHADDIVDDLDASATAAERAAALATFGDAFFADLARGESDDPVLAATVHTVRQWAIDPDCFRRFLASMAMDLTIDHYDTWDDLCVYMDGSAAVIGEMMLPILEPLSPAATEPARQLGIAFQLTNFLRDVGEDLERGRIYLPCEDLARFGADPRDRAVTPEWKAVMQFEIERAREIYTVADRGIDLLPPRSARCIGLARDLYSRILEHIERANYDVFTARARVPTTEKVLAAARAFTGRRRSVDTQSAARGAIGNKNP